MAQVLDQIGTRPNGVDAAALDTLADALKASAEAEQWEVVALLARELAAQRSRV